MFAIRPFHTRSLQSHSQVSSDRPLFTTTVLSLVWLLGSLPAAAVASAVTQAGALKQEPVDEAVRARIQESYGKLPLRFEANVGQTDAEVKFLSRGSGYSLFLTPTESVVVLSRPIEEKSATGEEKASKKATPSRKAGLEPEGKATASPAKRETAVVRMQVVGANPSPVVTGEEKLPGASNYFRGSDPTQWRTGVTNYKKVRYEEVYPGIDLVYYGNQRKLEYDFVVQPGADPNVIGLQFSGAEKLSVDDGGNLVLNTLAGPVIQEAPVVYQERDGQREPVSGEYVLGEDNRVAFAVGAYDHAKPLVIDPVLAYSTFLGGSRNDSGLAIAVDASGHAYVTGATGSTDFPTTAGAYDTSHNGGYYYNVFLTKLNSAGSSLVYSTFLGGSRYDSGRAIAVDASGHAYVTGETESTDFPTTAGAYDTSHNGSYEVFLTKLNSAGSSLVYSTFLGGSSNDSGAAIAVDASGHAYVTERRSPPISPPRPGLTIPAIMVVIIIMSFSPN